MINETEAIALIKSAKKIVLLEPQYKRKYLPLGLAKIATLAKRNGSEVLFQRNYSPRNEDLVCITSLFTYDSFEVLDAIRGIRFVNPKVKVLVGGVYASLMPEEILKRYDDVEVFQGYSKELDLCPPDYSIDWHIEEPWGDFSFVFTTRGCPNKCAYCSVWRIEPEIWVNPNWKEHIDKEKPFVMISDNNLSAQPMSHIEDICQYLIDNNKSVVFDNGFDCKHITPELAKLMGKLKFGRNGMRLAFDRIEEDGMFQKAVQLLIDSGVSKSNIMAYALFNFTDTPQEADYRMRECVKLGIRPYPQQYTPLNKTNRDETYIGKYWTKQLLRAFRFFWLMQGYFVNTTFEKFAQQNSAEMIKHRFLLDENDWKAFYYDKKSKDMRIKVVDNIGTGHEAHNVHDPSGIAPTFRENHGQIVKIIHNAYSGLEASPRESTEMCPTITTPSGGGHIPYVQVTKKDGSKLKAVEGTENDRQGRRVYKTDGCATSLQADGGNIGGKTGLYQMDDSRIDGSIRRLTPLEAERLQGFPDLWTAKGIDANGKEVAISDSQRYKVLGNAVTVNVIEALVTRMFKTEKEFKEKYNIKVRKIEEHW